MTKEEIKKLLKEAANRDQKVRKELLNKKSPKRLLLKMRRIDRENSKVIKEIIAKHGFISASKYGKETAKHAFLLVQHLEKQDIEYMERYLKFMKNNMSDANLEHFALLQDRVLIHKGRPQIYGTQLGINKKTGKPEVLNVLDSGNLNKRRQALGLETVEEYLGGIPK